MNGVPATTEPAWPTPRMLSWVENPPRNSLLHFRSPKRDWIACSYQDLAASALERGRALQRRGVTCGALVGIAQQTSAEMVAALCAVMLTGATACVLPAPGPMQTESAYAAHLARIFATSLPDAVLCDAENQSVVARCLVDPGSALVSKNLTLDQEDEAPPPLPGPGRYPLAQFTSGSTGPQRGVLVTADALNANHVALAARLGLREEDALISWLPNNHDMGLVGLLMGTLFGRCSGYFMQPQQFIRHPEDYLRCISDNGVAVTALPNFALEHLRRRVPERALVSLDLASLRSVIVGAERVDPLVLQRFYDRFGPRGLRPGALSPAYGSAETTLAVSLSPPGVPPGVAAPQGGHGNVDVVSCGPPLDGFTVRILGDDGQFLPEGQVGEILVSGPSVVTERLGSATTPAHEVDSDGLRTGDAGFLERGELFVLGRYGDGVKIRGSMVFAETLEGELVARGVSVGATVVLLGVLDTPTAVFLFADRHPERDRFAHEVGREHLGGTALFAIDVKPGEIRRTSSGKPRRRALWTEMTGGAFETRRRLLPNTKG